MGVTSFNRPVVNVSNMERSIAFYRDLLGMVLLSDNRTTEPDKADLKVRVAKVFNVSNMDLR